MSLLLLFPSSGGGAPPAATGTLAVTEVSTADTLTAAGAVVVHGTLSVAEPAAADTAAASGRVVVQGGLAVTESAAADTLAASGRVVVHGALADRLLAIQADIECLQQRRLAVAVQTTDEHQILAVNGLREVEDLILVTFEIA